MISPTIQTLLDRMEKFPEEFFDELSAITKYGFDDLIDGSRWEGVTGSILNNDRYLVFTPEEVAAYKSKLAEILRKKFEEDVCKELVGGEQREGFVQRQMELPGIPTKLLTVKEITNEALKILEQGMFNQTRQIKIKDHT